MGVLGSIGDTIDDVVDSVTGGTESEEAANEVSNQPSGSTGGSSAGSSGGSPPGGNTGGSTVPSGGGGSSGGGQTEAEAAAPSVSDPSSGGGSSSSPGGSSGSGGGSGGSSSRVPSYDLGGGSSAGSSGGSTTSTSSGGGGGDSSDGGGVVDDVADTANDAVAAVDQATQADEAAAAAIDSGVDAAQNAVGEATETATDAASDTVEAADEATQADEAIGNAIGSGVDAVQDTVDFVRSGPGEPSVGDDSFDIVADADDTGRADTPQRDRPTNRNLSVDEERTTNSTEGRSGEDVFNRSEIPKQTRQQLLNQTGADPQNATVSQVFVGETPETNTTTNLNETQRQQLKQQAATNDPFRSADDFAITGTQKAENGGVRVRFEAAPLKVETRRSGEALDQAIQEGIQQLNQQTPTREVERKDVTVARTDDGLRFEIEGDADLSREGDVVKLEQGQQTGTVTDTTSVGRNRPTARKLNEPKRNGSDDFTVLAPGPDFPKRLTVDELVEAAQPSAAPLQTDIPATLEAKREAVSNKAQRLLRMNPENVGAPLRSGIETGKDTTADVLGLREDPGKRGERGSVGNGGAKSGLAAAATFAVAAPEPVSSTIGAGILGGLALGGGITVAANEVFGGDEPAQSNQEVNELPTPERLPGDTTAEIDAPESGTVAGEQSELNVPESQQETGELGTPNRAPGDATGELGAPEVDDSTAGVDAPIKASEQTTRDTLLDEEDEPEVTEEDGQVTVIIPGSDGGLPITEESGDVVVDPLDPTRFYREDRDRLVSRFSTEPEVTENDATSQELEQPGLSDTVAGSRQPTDLGVGINERLDTGVDTVAATDQRLDLGEVSVTATQNDLLNQLNNVNETVEQTQNTTVTTTTTTGSRERGRNRRNIRLDLDLGVGSDENTDDREKVRGNEERFIAEGLDFSI